MVPPIVRRASVLLAALTLLAAAQQPARELRVGTATNGRNARAKLIGVEATNGVFQLENGRTTRVALESFPAPDRLLIRKGAPPKAAPPAPDSTGAPRPPATASPRSWPAIVEVPPDSVEITIAGQVPGNRRSVYQSEAFEFISQARLAGSVMKEVARTFEATRSLVSALPWGIDPKPPDDPGFYRVKLYVTREDYFADGGPANSGGFYASKDRTLRIPFPSLGLKMRGGIWFQKTDYRGETLVHEVTHQMMHDFLPFLPKWVIEGTAEYTGSLPCNAGRFLAGSHARGLKEYVRTNAGRRVAASRFRPFGEHIAMNADSWESLSLNPNSQQALYYQSYLLVYYFCHLDGDGRGARFLKYLDSIAGARDAWDAFFKNPAVKSNGDGSYTFPSSLQRPSARRSEEFGIEKLGILMDGRDPAALERDIRNGFRKLGIKL